MSASNKPNESANLESKVIAKMVAQFVMQWYPKSPVFKPCQQIQATGINKTRGQAYGKAVREVWAIASKALQQRAQEITTKRGKFTIIDLAQVSLEFGLSFKLTAEFLEELGVLPTGTYDRLKNSRGYRVSKYLDAARECAERETAAEAKV